jgi:hypothetical protein
VLAIGNIGKRREAAAGRHGGDGHCHAMDSPVNGVAGRSSAWGGGSVYSIHVSKRSASSRAATRIGRERPFVVAGLEGACR